MGAVVDTPQLEGWVPVRLYQHEKRPFIDWCYIGRRRFTDPGFSQTIESCIHRPFIMLFRHQTPIEILGQWSGRQSAIKPTGFVFHMSRCGSTLVSQMLAAVAQNIVIAEAAPIDSTIRARSTYPEASEAQRVEWLRWMIGALGQPREGSETRLFIKFDAWNILDFALIRQAFPGVPWIFLYRDPLQVLVSQLKHRGAHVIPGVFSSEFFGLDQELPKQAGPEEYCARILGSICRAGLHFYREGGGLLINYSQLPEVMFSSILDFFGVSCGATDLERMREVPKFDAKNPKLFFAQDTSRKSQQATDAVRNAAAEWLQPVYEELEQERLGAVFKSAL